MTSTTYLVTVGHSKPMRIGEVSRLRDAVALAIQCHRGAIMAEVHRVHITAGRMRVERRVPMEIYGDADTYLWGPEGQRIAFRHVTLTDEQISTLVAYTAAAFVRPRTEAEVRDRLASPHTDPEAHAARAAYRKRQGIPEPEPVAQQLTIEGVA